VRQRLHLRKRLQRFLISGIVISVLVALVILLIGSAALFLLIGVLKFLSTFMPVWMAWTLMGLTSAFIAALLFGVLFIVIKKQLKIIYDEAIIYDNANRRGVN